MDHLPGTPEHQSILRAVIEHYRDDRRILAVGLFGSLSLGRWDEFSDCDLDIVVADAVQVDVAEELRRLAGSLREPDALILYVRGADNGDIVLSSLCSLSLRFHTLTDTSPNIAPGLTLLTSRIDRDAVVSAATARRTRSVRPYRSLLIHSLRSLLAADVALHRRHRWQTLHMLEEARTILLEIVVRPKGGGRLYRTADALASDRWIERLGATVPSFDLTDMQRALVRSLDLVEEDLGALSGGRMVLTPAQRAFVRRIRERQAALNLSSPEDEL